MRSANSDVATARKTPSPTLIGGSGSVPSPSATTDCCSTHGLVVRVGHASNPTMITISTARTSNELVMELLAQGLRRTRSVGFLRTEVGGVKCSLEARRLPARRRVLRDEVVGGARNAVIVGPAIDDRQRGTEIAVLRRRVWRLPFERRR